ncbi:MAG: 2Fe-2S iron-sulfur cluster-binding protein, partial [Myxococcota bacterium]
MPTLTINGVEVEVDKGTTLLQAAAVAGYEVPHFCYHPALSAPANCRMCLVEVEGQRKLLPACYNTVADGWVVHTESEEVIKARKAVLEFILVNHPVDCPICDKAGECKLQDYYFAYDAQESRMRAEKQHKVKAYPIGPRVVYDGERCILCTRCIRFCEEITGTNELTLVDRDDKIEVRTFPGMELDNDYSLCTVDVCPVGALTSRDFRFKCRVWLLTSTESVCASCATNCSIHMDHFRNEVQRYRPRYNPQVNDYWMCDSGRMSYKLLHQGRLLSPLSNGARVTWRAVGRTLAAKMEAAATHGRRVAFVVSPQASCEDLHLAKMFVEQAIQADVKLYIGGRPFGPSDDFLRHADKNPNREGVRRVFVGLEQFGSLSQLAADLEEGAVDVVYMMGSEVDGTG